LNVYAFTRNSHQVEGRMIGEGKQYREKTVIAAQTTEVGSALKLENEEERERKNQTKAENRIDLNLLLIFLQDVVDLHHRFSDVIEHLFVVALSRLHQDELAE